MSGCSRGDRDRSGPTQESALAGRAEPAGRGEASPPSSSIDWFVDDYDGAVAAAREHDKPLAVVLWAPWCNTCLSLQNVVLPDPGLEPVADRFVWAKIDTDRDVNAPVLEKLSIEVWPTSYVLSPDEAVQARLTSAASVSQFRDFLLEGERAHIDAAVASGDVDADSPLALARRGDRALSRDAYEAAVSAYERALERAEGGWVRRPDVLVSYMHASMRAGATADCAEIARRHIRETGTSTSAVRFSRYAGWCARDQESDEVREELYELADAWLAELLAGENQLSQDDRSTALRARREIHDALGRKERARALARAQRDLLDRAADEAPHAFAAMTYSGPRCEVYAYLGEPEALVSDLVELAGELPNHYDPSYRVAWIQHKAGALDEAAEWAERAAAVAYGPRKAQVLVLLADIHRAAGDASAERQALARLIAHLESLPAGQARPDRLREARERLGAIAG